ncbi:MAG: RNase H family protein, partial [Terrimicrobiaceae bacterium]
QKHRITWQWLKGHAGHEGNERCDELANAAMDKIQAKFTPEQLKEALGKFVSETQCEPALELF